MARRSGRMFLSKQNPMLTQKFGEVDPDYASNYDVLTGGKVDTTKYAFSKGGAGLPYGAQLEEEEKSQTLDEYREKYGSEMDNYIAGQFQQNAVDHITHGSIPLMNNETTMTQAQDEFLQAMDVQGRMDKQMGLRDTKGRVRRARQTWNAMYGGKGNWQL